jgi:hypothetical protein
MIDGAPIRSTELADVLLDSLRQLAAAGETEAACRLAGQACAVLRRDDPRNWRRFNALLHRLARPHAAAGS